MYARLAPEQRPAVARRKTLDAGLVVFVVLALKVLVAHDRARRRPSDRPDRAEPIIGLIVDSRDARGRRAKAPVRLHGFARAAPVERRVELGDRGQDEALRLLASALGCAGLVELVALDELGQDRRPAGRLDKAVLEKLLGAGPLRRAKGEVQNQSSVEERHPQERGGAPRTCSSSGRGRQTP